MKVKSKFHPYTHKNPNEKQRQAKKGEKKNLQCGFYCVRELRNGNGKEGDERKECKYNNSIQFALECINVDIYFHHAI